MADSLQEGILLILLQADRTHGITDWFKIGKEVRQACTLASYSFNFFAEFMLGGSQAGIKIAWRIINNLRYADNTTLMAESEDELKSLLIRVKEESEKALKNIQNRKSWHPVLSLYGK